MHVEYVQAHRVTSTLSSRAVAYGYETITDTLLHCMYCFVPLKFYRFDKATADIQQHLSPTRNPAQDTLGADSLAY